MLTMNQSSGVVSMEGMVLTGTQLHGANDQTMLAVKEDTPVKCVVHAWVMSMKIPLVKVG